MTDFRPHTQAAIAALRAGVPYIKARQGGDDVWAKAPGDLVTGTDLLVQAVIQQVLHEQHPDVGFVGEEGSEQIGLIDTRRYWLVDPVCGTANYAAGIPLFAVNIALVEDGQVSLSAVADGATGELYVAERGGSAWRLTGVRAQRVHASPHTRLVSVDPHGGPTASLGAFGRTFSARAFEQTDWDVRVLSTTLALAYVASGRLAGAVYAALGSPVHTAAGLLLAQEAGAIVTDQRGAAWNLASDVYVVAADGALHQDLLALARAVREDLG